MQFVASSLNGWLRRRDDQPSGLRSAIAKKKNENTFKKVVDAVCDAVASPVASEGESSSSGGSSSTCVASGSEAGIVTPSTALPAAAEADGGEGKKKGKSLLSVQQVELGTRIRLKVKSLTVAVEQYDPIGNRYLLRDDYGGKCFESLHGPGAIKWTVVQKAYKPPKPRAVGSRGSSRLASGAAPTEAQERRQLQQQQQQQQRSQQDGKQVEVALLPQCPICLCDIEEEGEGEEGGGRMPCCDKLVHKKCIAEWCRHSMKPRSMNRGLKDEKVANTKTCPLCKAQTNGTMSVRRIFSDKPPCL